MRCKPRRGARAAARAPIEKGPETVKAETQVYMSKLHAELDLKGASEATLHAALCCSLIYAGVSMRSRQGFYRSRRRGSGGRSYLALANR